MLRPYWHNGVPCVTINTGKMVQNHKTGEYGPEYKAVTVRSLQDRGVQSPVFNTTVLRKEEWLMLDQKVVRAARTRLRVYADLAAANSYGGFNGMTKMILEYEAMSDPGDAVVDMDGITQGQRNDTPLFQLQGLPLPITHSDFWMSSRMLAVSRNSNTPLDTTMAEASARRVGETLEKTTLGVINTQQYGGFSTLNPSYGPGGATGAYARASKVWGYATFPAAKNFSSTFRKPSGTTWTPLMTVQDFLSARQSFLNERFYGPWMVYHSNDWDQYLDQDYIAVTAASGSPTAGVTTQTLRDRLRSIEGIMDVRRADMLFATAPAAGIGNPSTAFYNNLYAATFIFVQMTPEVCQAVNGMDITVVQWETKGGMQLNFKVMCIQVPKLQADYYGNCGIGYATASVNT